MLRPGAVSWWRGVTVTQAPARLAAGEELSLSVRSPLGYRLRTRLRIASIEHGRSLVATSTGDLAGRGSIRVEPADGGAELVFTWDVRTTTRWMNATAFVLRPAFERAHATVMRRGEAGMRATLLAGPASSAP